MSEIKTVRMPEAVDIEKSVLSSCIVYPEMAEEVVECLDKQAFYRTAHQIFFEAIKHLVENHAAIDLATVGRYIRDQKLDSQAPISELAALMDHPVSVNLAYNIKILSEKSALRKALEICNAGIKRCQDTTASADETIEFIRNGIGEIDGNRGQESVKPVSDLTLETSERYDLIASGKVDPGIRSGFYHLDQKLSGFKKKMLYFLAARPSMGKTAMDLNIAFNSGARTIIFSLEQSKEQLMDRLVSISTRIDLSKITDAKMNDYEWGLISQSLGAIHQKNILIDDTPALTVGQVRSRLRTAIKRYGTELCFIDYLQLMKPDFRRDGNRNLEVGKMAQGLKAMAKEFDIPVIVNSQLNRSLENRPNPNKVPKLSDLRDSGEIEQVADVVLFLYRPEIYNDLESIKFEGQCDLIIAKNRQGPLGIDRLRFVGENVRFENMNLYLEA